MKLAELASSLVLKEHLTKRVCDVNSIFMPIVIIDHKTRAINGKCLENNEMRKEINQLDVVEL